MRAARPSAATFTALIAEYHESPEWNEPALATRKDWRRAICVSSRVQSVMAGAADRPDMVALRERRLVFHGLRKSAVVFLLEAGCTDAETAAITGQSRDMVEHYAKQVNQQRLAAAAILKWKAADAAQH
jgi:hypothetical protein